MSTPRHWIVLGAILAGLAVVFGAFGAHGLEGRLAEIYGDEVKSIGGLEVPATFKYLRDFSTAAEYQMYHAIGLLVLGIAAGQAAEVRTGHKVAAWCFLLGILFFSGSLYVLVLTGLRWLGAITPIGGTLMIIGWVGFAAAQARSGKTTESKS
jgi:uncharacterized membrane protein YgdD (TMEM256/DUF423 family)